MRDRVRRILITEGRANVDAMLSLENLPAPPPRTLLAGLFAAGLYSDWYRGSWLGLVSLLLLVILCSGILL